MSDYEDIGDTFYAPIIRSNVLSRKRLTKVDSDGNEWYRYDSPVWVGEVQEVTLVGVESIIIEGKVPEYAYQESSVTLYFEFPDGTISTLDEWFVSKRDAQLWLDKELAERNGV